MDGSLLGCANLLWQKMCHIVVWAANIVKNGEMATKNITIFPLYSNLDYLCRRNYKGYITNSLNTIIKNKPL